MSKISKVKLSNFRIFTDDFNQVDFNNENGLPADFICIYGQNGMGKTSFFDGIEWFSSGTIYRFEDKNMKKEIKRYKGYVLSNRNIDGNNDKSYVEVNYSDNCTVKRTVTKSSKDINEKGYRDYNKGRLNPQKFKMNIMAKQILPHNKIDSFIHANSPNDKYEEWGKFWDSDGSQRKLFTKVYKVKKLIAKRIDLIKRDCEDAIEELRELTISDEKIKEINNKINDFNILETISGLKLKEVIKSENEIINIPDKNKIREYKNSVNKIIDNEKLNIDKLIYLLNYYGEDYTQKKIELNNKIKKIIDNIDRYKQLNEAGDIWFKEYNQWKQLDSNLKLINRQLKFKLSSLEFKYKELDNINEEINKLKSSFEILNDKENYFLTKCKFIEGIINEISNKKYKNKVNIDTLQKLDIIKKHNQKIISNLEEAKLNKERKNFDIHISSVVEDDERFILLKKIYIDKYKNLKNKIENNSKEVIKKKELYFSCKKSFDELQNILMQVKGYIEKEDLNNCPVCHTPFKDIGLLLSKINLDEQSNNCKKLYDNYQLALSHKEKALNEEKELIDKWNEECEKYKVVLGEEISNLTQKITRVIRENEKLKEDIKLDELKVNEFKEELDKISKYEKDFSQDSIKEWLNIIKKSYKSKLDKSIRDKEKLYLMVRELDKESRELKLNIKELEDKNDDFNQKDINKILVAKLEEINTINKSKIKEWIDFEKYYSSLIIKNEELKKQIKDIDKYIRGYEKNDYKDIFKEKYLKYNKNSYRDYMLQIFKGNYIDFSNLILLCKEKKHIIENLKRNIDILDYINIELCNSNYNEKYSVISKNISIKKYELKKYEASKNKIDGIFYNLKKYIEENIEEVLGSKPMNQIYSIIEPNKEFKKLKIEVSFTNSEDGEDIPELYLKSSGDENEDILPEYFFSTAQLNTVALSIFLGQALSMDLEVKTIFIDDPVGHFDDINVLAFVDLLRNIIKDGEWQIVISTHDESFYNILKNKISDEYYNSKFITFSSVGKLSESNIN
ncbi:AAA family ATPase [Clostridium chauvoei]|uniref:AAA family ATPase n=1 Tax=Clostridium chauvoei TaxID=46867 RepID=UPI001C846FB7|nr:AAA family ATPase [Clostridium chauvoei]MBX7380601.1 AAA family ATPase [Clostridium chauvoei]